ncbi:MAG: RNA polymerase sigma factor [Planctomycetaceae bacterium]
MHDNARFATTRWSLVQAAGNEDQSLSESAYQQALGELCTSYWFPVYAHCRRKGAQPDDAEDQTQEFFARILNGNLIQSADPDRGRFRSYLLTALDHFVANEYRKGQAAKRGGGAKHVAIDVADAESRIGVQPATNLTPEDEFEKRWAIVMLSTVYDSLQGEQTDDSRRRMFDELRDFLPGNSEVPYAVVADKLKMSAGAVKVAIHRLRKRFGQLLRNEIAQTVASVDEVDDEIRRLQIALGK